MQSIQTGQTITQQMLDAMTQTADVLSDFIVSGLIGTVPSTASLSMTLPGGSAYLLGQATVINPGQAQQINTYAASTTTYVDISPAGVYTYTTSSTVTAGAVRIMSVTTNTTQITAVTQILPYAPDMTLENVTVNKDATIGGNVSASGTISATGTLSGAAAAANGDAAIVGDTNTGSIGFTGSLTAVGVVDNVATASLAGTTAGTIEYAQTGGTIKRFVGVASGYENDTTTNQTITFPVAFANTPIVSANNTGLTVSATTTTLTITAPDVTTTYSGTIVVEGI